MKKKKTTSTKVLQKDKWLSLALESITKTGEGVPSVEALCKSLGVSRGSFYWHFKDRRDFLRCLSEYWANYSVEQVIEKLSSFRGSAEDRLLFIMKMVIPQNRGRHYLNMRFLSMTEPEVEKVLKEFDKKRLSFVKNIFHEMGFRNAELDARTEAFVYFMTGEHVFLKNKPMTMKKLKQLWDIFTVP
jgi:AcrR family transcriptional regulator